jgi:HPt (histidine-containing phosphotransfer) domain-containing protein
MTAFAMAGDRERCIESGMDDYLAKPFTPDALRQVIQRSAKGPAVEPQRAPERAPEAPIDWTRIESLKPYDADGSMVREAVGAFLRDAPKYLQAMLQASGSADTPGLAAAAHALKGAAANVGAKRLEANCREVEELARSKRTGAAAGAVEHSARHVDEALSALRPLASA